MAQAKYHTIDDDSELEGITSGREQDSLLRLLVLDDQDNDIQALVSALGNAGLAVHLTRCKSLKDLDQTLREQALEMVICAADASDPSLLQTFHAIQTSGKDLPLLAWDREYNENKVVTVMALGVRDYLTKQNSDHMTYVVKRELGDLKVRRKMRTQESALREFDKHCHALLENSRDAITYVHEGMHLYANPAYLEMFGFTDKSELEGIPLMDMVATEDQGKVKEFLKKHSKEQDASSSLEVKGLRPNGNTFSALMEFSPASVEGEPCTQIIIRVQTHDKELEQKLKFLSKQDVLTGLYNRQYFMEELEQAISHAINGSQPSAVLYLEPDNFRQIKENVGIAGGDLVLSDIAQIVKGLAGEHMVCARFGDSTFTLLIPSGDQKLSQALAEQIREAIEHHISEVGGKSITLTVSIGISLAGETAVSAQDILTKADLACEVAHKNGGNRLHLHNPIADLQAGKDRDQYWTEMVRVALEHNKFRLVYQPIASLQGDTTERYEILVRMTDEDGKEILPGKFLPVAEQSDLIIKVDRWIIANAIRVLAERRQRGCNTLFFIKISGKTLTDENLLPWLSTLLTKSRLPGDALVFQLSEPTAVSYLKFAKIFAKGLEQLRCGFGLEDFGNGMNSFQLLKHLSVNYLKIDGAFVHNLANNKENQAIIKSIVEMASSLGKPVIAEFVEDPNSLTVLWQSGVQFIQGNFLQKPTEAMSFDFVGESETPSLF